MKIKPILDKVVLQEIKTQQNNSKIIIPSSVEEKSQLAKVVAVGEGGIIDGINYEMKVKINDTVIFSKYAGSEFVLENEKYIVVRQSDILAIIE